MRTPFPTPGYHSCPLDTMLIVNNSLPGLVRSSLGVSNLNADKLLESSARDEISMAITSSYTQWCDSFVEPPEKPANVLRPLIAPSSLSSFNEISACLKALLLCQQVAVVLPDTMGYLSRLFHVLTVLGPFIDNGLIILLPEGNFSHDHTNLSFTRAQPRRSLNKSLSLEQKLAIAEDISSGYEVGMALDYCCAYPDSLDMTCLNSVQSDKLRSFLDASIASIPRRLMQSSDRLMYLPGLLSLDMPRMHVSIADLLAIHEYGLFDSWKGALERGLSRVAQLGDVDLLDPSSAKLREVRQELEEAAQMTASQVRKSSILRTAQMETAKFGIAAASGALGALGGPVDAAIAGGASYLVTALVDWLGGRPNRGEQAFRRMVVNFTSESITE
jgi:hypothetical protein